MGESVVSFRNGSISGAVFNFGGESIISYISLTFCNCYDECHQIIFLNPLEIWKIMSSLENIVTHSEWAPAHQFPWRLLHQPKFPPTESDDSRISSCLEHPWHPSKYQTSPLKIPRFFPSWNLAVFRGDLVLFCWGVGTSWNKNRVDIYHINIIQYIYIYTCQSGNMIFPNNWNKFMNIWWLTLRLGWVLQPRKQKGSGLAKF